MCSCNNVTHLCWCSTSSSMLRCSERAGPSDPRLPRLQEGDGAACLVRPLILFNPRSPLVRVFFLSCWRKALRPAWRCGKLLCSVDPTTWYVWENLNTSLGRWHTGNYFTIMHVYLVWGRCQRLCDPPGSWQGAGCPGPGAGGGKREPGELQQTAELLPQPPRPEVLPPHLQQLAKWGQDWKKTSGSCQRRHRLRGWPRYLKKQERSRLCIATRMKNMRAHAYYTNMEGCTGGNGRRPQPECVCERWWLEGAGAQEFASPPPPPGLWVAPLRWCLSPAGCWVKWSGSRAICSDWPPLETLHAEKEGGWLLATDC